MSLTLSNPLHATSRLQALLARWPTRRLSFALANTLAVTAALYLAFAFDLQRPYWAAFSVFIVAAPLSGMVRSKAIYRLAGTLVGGAGALLMVPPLVQSPPLLCIAMSAWVGFWVWLSLLDRSPRSYVPLLAGYTAAIVGLAVVDAPEAIFDTMVARLEEISLGITCAALAHTLFFPRDVRGELGRRTAQAIRDCAGCMAQTLAGEATPAQAAMASTRLAQAVGELYALHTHLAFDSWDAPRIAGSVRVLQDRLAGLLPALSNARGALEALRVHGALRAPLAARVNALVRWAQALADASGPADAPALPPALQGSATASPPRGGRGDAALIEQAATTHLLALAALFEDCRLLARAVREPDAALPARLARETRVATRVPLYADRGVALLAGVTATAGMLASCALWILGSWPEGGIAVQFVAIGCSLFANQDQPARVLLSALVGVLLALPVAALYQFAILPGLDGFAPLALALAPAMLALGYMQSVERLAGLALISGITFTGALALQETYQADFAVFVNVNLAQIAGLLLSLAIMRVLRTLDPAWNARRLARANWRALARMAERGCESARTRPVQMLDRAGQVSVRLQQAGGDAAASADVLRSLRVAANLVALEAADDARASRFARTRALLAARCRERARSTTTAHGAAFAATIDGDIAALGDGSRNEADAGALAALVSLRLDFAPLPALANGSVS